MSMYDLTILKTWLILLFLTLCSINIHAFAQDSNTVLLYTFEDVSNDIVTDLSGNGNDATNVGAEWDAGKIQKGLTFGGDAQGDFLEIPVSDSLDLTTGLTIEMWVYLNSEPTAGGVGVTRSACYKVGPRNNLIAELRMDTTTNAWGSANLNSQSDLSLLTWTHIAATYDAATGEAKMYIDGEIDNETTIGGDIVPNAEPIWIGRGGTPFLDGKLDEIRISNIARSQAEIQQLMNIGIDAVLSVTPQDKVSTTWGKIKKSLLTR